MSIIVLLLCCSGREWNFIRTCCEPNETIPWCGWSYAVDSTRTTIPSDYRLCTYTRWATNVLETLEKVKVNRVITIMGHSGGNRDPSMRPELGEIV